MGARKSLPKKKWWRRIFQDLTFSPSSPLSANKRLDRFSSTHRSFQYRICVCRTCAWIHRNSNSICLNEKQRISRIENSNWNRSIGRDTKSWIFEPLSGKPCHLSRHKLRDGGGIRSCVSCLVRSRSAGEIKFRTGLFGTRVSLTLILRWSAEINYTVGQNYSPLVILPNFEWYVCSFRWI